MGMSECMYVLGLRVCVCTFVWYCYETVCVCVCLWRAFVCVSVCVVACLYFDVCFGVSVCVFIFAGVWLVFGLVCGYRALDAVPMGQSTGIFSYFLPFLELQGPPIPSPSTY